MNSHLTRDPYQQMDDGFSRGMELALTPFVAGGIGYIIDRVIGTVPLMTIIFVLLAVVATFVKMYYVYDAEMKAHDAESPWGRARAHADQIRANRELAATGDPGRTLAGRSAPARAHTDRVHADGGDRRP